MVDPLPTTSAVERISNGDFSINAPMCTGCAIAAKGTEVKGTGTATDLYVEVSV